MTMVVTIPLGMLKITHIKHQFHQLIKIDQHPLQVGHEFGEEIG
jgi:hypothetical protein